MRGRPTSRGDMEKIIFNQFNAVAHFLFNGIGIDEHPETILDIYRAMAQKWHAAGERAKGRGSLSAKRAEKERAQLHGQLLELKVGIRLLVDAGVLGSGKIGTPYGEALKVILGTWLDSRREAHERIMGKADADLKQVLDRVGAVNLISRPGLPALVVINGKTDAIFD